jgi:hypothetical protein
MLCLSLSQLSAFGHNGSDGRTRAEELIEVELARADFDR